MSDAGRVCPLHYHYSAQALSLAVKKPAETLYVIGGLYGNAQALHIIEALAAEETGAVTLCFNGDFNWFNIDDTGFRAINTAVLRHDAILGNVEAELLSDTGDAGCGCAYPESVDQGVVERSNAIHARLCHTAERHVDIQAAFSSLPMFARYQVGDLRIGVVHGDADSLAGWRFDVDALNSMAGADWRAQAFTKAAVDVFASTHTCLPVMCRSGPDRLIANNGAAGMPNFLKTKFGVLTRISTRPSPHVPLYGCRIKDVHIDALPVYYDHAQWEIAFLANWPPASAAWMSYFKRITDGPNHMLEQACCKVISASHDKLESTFFRESTRT